MACAGDVPTLETLPYPDARRAMTDRLLHRQPLRRGLFSRHDDVHIMPAPQTMVGGRKQAIGIRRKIYADNIRLLVDNVVDETNSPASSICLKRRRVSRKRSARS